MNAADAPAAGPVPSPCTGVCRIEPADGCCAGCGRTLDEIAAWSTLDDAGKRVVLARLVTGVPRVDPGSGASPL